MPEETPRPALLKLGIGLLAAHEVVVVALCALAGAIGTLALFLGATGLDLQAGGIALVLVVLGGLLLVGLMACALFSLAVCVLAWRGSRRWVQVLIGVALLNCVVVLPNPLGILAAVFCVLGGLEHLQGESRARTSSGDED